jgi:orotidine-5'-phosphate decarboxylase
MAHNILTHKVFCAIDEPEYEAAMEIAKKAVPFTKAYKLGMTFFNRNGSEGVARFQKELNAELLEPAELFLDLKSHDIPQQVAGAVSAIVPLQPEFITIHTSGGKDMMQAAVKSVKEAAQKAGVTAPKILGITVLTSLDAENLAEIGQGDDIEAQVLRLAKLAQDSGLDGVVCSPFEIQAIRRELGDDFILMVPGVRPAGSAQDDQKRIMTPDQAIAAGASHLVIGRPITQSDDPAFVVQFIRDEIERYI